MQLPQGGGGEASVALIVPLSFYILSPLKSTKQASYCGLSSPADSGRSHLAVEASSCLGAQAHQEPCLAGGVQSTAAGS